MKLDKTACKTNSPNENGMFLLIEKKKTSSNESRMKNGSTCIAFVTEDAFENVCLSARHCSPAKLHQVHCHFSSTQPSFQEMVVPCWNPFWSVGRGRQRVKIIHQQDTYDCIYSSIQMSNKDQDQYKQILRKHAGKATMKFLHATRPQLTNITHLYSLF